MAKHLDTDNMVPRRPRQEPKVVVGGDVTYDEKLRIVSVFDQYGWNQSRGVATLCRAFIDSTAVRDAVMAHVHSVAAA